MAQTLVIDGLKRRNWPINLRQSGNSDARILISTRIRKSPWWHLSKAAGCWAYTTYNHLYHPRAYIKPKDGGLLAEYEFLTKHVSMWDVAVERQIMVKGPDAADFVNLLITRDVHSLLPPMQARYVILCNQYGGIVNDPVLLRVAEDEFWFSISDSDVLLWAQGVNSFANFDVDIHEIDVSPVQIQGPKSVQLMEKMFGPHIRDIPYYGLIHDTLNGHDVTVSRTGFSAEIGFEIYLHDATLNADDVWPHILEQGEEFNLGVIAPSHITAPRSRHPLLRPRHGHRVQPVRGAAWLAGRSRKGSGFHRQRRFKENPTTRRESTIGRPRNGRKTDHLVQRGLLHRKGR